MSAPVKLTVCAMAGRNCVHRTRGALHSNGLLRSALQLHATVARHVPKTCGHSTGESELPNRLAHAAASPSDDKSERCRKSRRQSRPIDNAHAKWPPRERRLTAAKSLVVTSVVTPTQQHCTEAHMFGRRQSEARMSIGRGPAAVSREKPEVSTVLVRSRWMTDC